MVSSRSVDSLAGTERKAIDKEDDIEQRVSVVACSEIEKQANVQSRFVLKHM